MKKTYAALITGASSGIGKELTRIHASYGGDCIIVGRNIKELNKLKKDLEALYSVDIVVIKQDLLKPNAAKTIIDKVKKSKLKIDLLINCAGVGGLGQFHERSIDDEINMINLNIKFLTEITHQVLECMTSRNEGQILNVASSAALVPGPKQAVYFASKAYVRSFSLALSKELEDYNIQVSCLLPGATDTKFASNANLEKSNLFSNPASVYKVALDAYNGLQKGKLEIYSGVPLKDRISFKFLSIAPHKIVLNQVSKLHEDTNKE